jgi:hypothetical protein
VYLHVCRYYSYGEGGSDDAGAQSRKIYKCPEAVAALVDVLQQTDAEKFN